MSDFEEAKERWESHDDWKYAERDAERRFFFNYGNDQLRAEKAELVEAQELAKKVAESLALSLWKQFYNKDSPNFELCDSPAGVITQIDNMIAGIIDRYQSDLTIAVSKTPKRGEVDDE